MFCVSFNAYSHNPEDFVIAEIERGQMNFENEEIAAEYGAALKRQRARRLAAMPLYKKFYIFVKAGFEHIIPQGLDHILFVLGLFFSCITFRSLLWQVTAFTVAHSITLVLAAQGLVQLRGDIVEIIIALSIVWIAIENCLYKETSKWRYLVVFSFGLLHGLGFAALLTQYGLPKENFISLLLAFNIGVEFGQLAVLVIAFLLIKLVLRKNWYSNQIKIPASIIIALVGLFWFVERVFQF
ncbi:HupE/UreJ family protein [Flavobacteriaceae bacterium]|nr:HupE/UreJ family protein [Flavobacteriaceae bacterium]MDC1372124.1 HupE/UreJ family protein [Flavobacteriaceae bacterium]